MSLLLVKMRGRMARVLHVEGEEKGRRREEGRTITGRNHGISL